jgi:hypothetical protein
MARAVLLPARNSASGTGHIELFVVAAVLFVVGFGGYTVLKRNKTPAEPAAACLSNDPDLCAFFDLWKSPLNYSARTTNTVGDMASTGLYQAVGADKFHLTVTGSYELIGIGNTIYIKDNSDGRWWKQSVPADTVYKYKSVNLYDFRQPTANALINYVKAATEKCGSLTCLKYQVSNQANPGLTQYILFDSKQHLLRGVQNSTATSTTTASFSYDKPNISAPSPVKKVGVNQIILPGQTDPTTLPGAGDVQNALEQAPPAQ